MIAGGEFHGVNMEHRENKAGSPATSSGQADGLQLAGRRLEVKLR
ncbi:MAG: hypothetical protein P8075_07615 [Deltaproteobacteria bacterium]|jgi:hypothetical protein